MMRRHATRVACVASRRAPQHRSALITPRVTTHHNRPAPASRPHLNYRHSIQTWSAHTEEARRKNTLLNTGYPQRQQTIKLNPQRTSRPTQQLEIEEGQTLPLFNVKSLITEGRAPTAPNITSTNTEVTTTPYIFSLAKRGLYTSCITSEHKKAPPLREPLPLHVLFPNLSVRFHPTIEGRPRGILIQQVAQRYRGDFGPRYAIEFRLRKLLTKYLSESDVIYTDDEKWSMEWSMESNIIHYTQEIIEGKTFIVEKQDVVWKDVKKGDRTEIYPEVFPINPDRSSDLHTLFNNMQDIGKNPGNMVIKHRNRTISFLESATGRPIEELTGRTFKEITDLERTEFPHYLEYVPRRRDDKLRLRVEVGKKTKGGPSTYSELSFEIDGKAGKKVGADNPLAFAKEIEVFLPRQTVTGKITR